MINERNDKKKTNCFLSVNWTKVTLKPMRMVTKMTRKEAKYATVFKWTKAFLTSIAQKNWKEKVSLVVAKQIISVLLGNRGQKCFRSLENSCVFCFLSCLIGIKPFKLRLWFNDIILVKEKEIYDYKLWSTFFIYFLV